MKISIIKGRPPNFEKIAAVFPGAYKAGTIFSYGNEIYVTSEHDLTPALFQHEGVHCSRQMQMGVDLWWDKYLTDERFRYNEEMIAHQAEYQKAMQGSPNRNARRSNLNIIAKRLSSPLYGRMVSFEQAKKDIAS